MAIFLENMKFSYIIVVLVIKVTGYERNVKLHV